MQNNSQRMDYLYQWLSAHLTQLYTAGSSQAWTFMIYHLQCLRSCIMLYNEPQPYTAFAEDSEHPVEDIGDDYC